MISLMDLMEAEYMSEDFDNNLRGGFREYKELLEEKDRPVLDMENNETVYSFTLR
jgi:succinate dehydrogenase flavin-adding protein (antitoxin of CptAB toxin-antitoxin module)